MGFLDPMEEAEWEYENSKLISAPVSEAIYNQAPHLDIDTKAQEAVIKDLRRRKGER